MPPDRSSTAFSEATALPAADVLVLGAGLAGFSAAISAKQTTPDARVLLVSPRKKAAGSSFANRNNALGMQVPQPHEADAFIAEALRLAAPGLALPELVRALAEDAPARLDDLLALGLNFRRNADNSLTRFPGCFSSAPRAVVFDGLAQAHAAFLAQARALGVAFLLGCEALALLKNQGGRVCGALLQPTRGGEAVRIRAKAVIAALGGPAPLYRHRICGPGGSGLSYGLLLDAGARLVNTRYLQFFWSELPTLSFVNPGELSWPEALAHLTPARRTHCPAAHGLPDAALDLALLPRLGPDGVVRAQHAVRGEIPLVLAAHAGNGGALIDAQGRTTAAGLYACGECAAGMHGANRLGGAMVLSALVFGTRAGAAAGQEAAGLAEMPRVSGTPHAATHARPGFVHGLRLGMQRHGMPGPSLPGSASPGRDDFVNWLKTTPHGGREALLARSALAVLGEG